MSAQMLEVSLVGVGTVLRLGRDTWSMVKWLRQAPNESAPPPLWYVCLCPLVVFRQVYLGGVKVSNQLGWYCSKRLSNYLPNLSLGPNTVGNFRRALRTVSPPENPRFTRWDGLNHRQTPQDAPLSFPRPFLSTFPFLQRRITGGHS